MINKKITLELNKLIYGAYVPSAYRGDSEEAIAEYQSRKAEFANEKYEVQTSFEDYMNLSNSELGQKPYTAIKELTKSINLWTNLGKISKSDDNYKFVVANNLVEAYEEAFQTQMNLEANADKVNARAQKLAEIVNSADFNSDDLVLVQTKTSKSKWYATDYEGKRSVYYRYVPIEVEAEVRELIKIRKENQNNPNFDFYRSEWNYVEKRDADHSNFYTKSARAVRSI